MKRVVIDKEEYRKVKADVLKFMVNFRKSTTVLNSHSFSPDDGGYPQKMDYVTL